MNSHPKSTLSSGKHTGVEGGKIGHQLKVFGSAVAATMLAAYIGTHNSPRAELVFVVSIGSGLSNIHVNLRGEKNRK